MEYGRQFGRYLIIDRLAARISHPNVAQVVELGQHKGSFFIAMECVEGESLSMLLRRRWLPWSVGGRILADALGGLHAAHEIHTPTGEPAELVHRDLSPSTRREPRLVWPRTEDETLVATPASGGAARVDVRVVDRSSRDGGVSVPQRPVPNPRAADTKRARFRARERTSNARAGRLLGSPYAD